MGGYFSRRKKITLEFVLQVHECIEQNRLEELKEALKPYDKAQRQVLFQEENLRDSLDRLFGSNDLPMARYLIQECGMAPDGHSRPATPLYRAMKRGSPDYVELFCESGADASRCDEGMEDSSCDRLPLVHLAVRSNLQRLVPALVKAGADINAKDIAGNNCLQACALSRYRLYDRDFTKIDVSDSVWGELHESLLQQEYNTKAKGKSQRLSEFKVALYDLFDTERAMGMTKTCDAIDRIQMLELLGAWVGVRDDLERALSLWRDAMKQRWQSKVFPVPKEPPENSFAQILKVSEPVTQNDLDAMEKTQQNIEVQSLLILERTLPSVIELSYVAYKVVFNLLIEGESKVATDIIWHLSNTKQLVHTERMYILHLVPGILCLGLDCSSALKLLTTLKDCLSWATQNGTFGNDISATTRHNSNNRVNPYTPETCTLCFEVDAIRSAFLGAMMVFLRGNSEEDEQKREFHNIVREFVRWHPWIRGKNILHLVCSSASLPLDSHDTVIVIKVLAQCSAELRGKIPQERCPPHLVKDRSGDTPLHLVLRTLDPALLLDGELVKWFLEYGEHPCTMDSSGRSIRSLLPQSDEISRLVERVPRLECLAAVASTRGVVDREKVQQFPIASVRNVLLDHMVPRNDDDED